MSKDEKRAAARQELRDELEDRIEDVALRTLGLLCDIMDGRKSVVLETKRGDDGSLLTSVLVLDHPDAGAAEGV